MNKKGFTLVELVAVVVILSLIALIALPVLLNSIRDNKNTISEATAKIIYTATDLYLDTYMTTYPKINGNTYCVSLSTLVDSGDLAPNLYDVNTNSNVDMTKMVKVDVVEGKYEYKIVDIHECEVKKCDFEIGHTWEFSYTGSEQSFAVPCDGTYMIELYGAEGGTSNNSYLGGAGAYTKGEIQLLTDTNIYVYVGQKGQASNVGYNGGGTGRTGYSPYNVLGSGGGGATDIRLVSGSWNNFESLKSRIMVAAGGGAGGYLNSDNSGNGGSGGGLVGYYATENIANLNYLGNRYSDTGGSQVTGGNISNPDRNGQVSGSFGMGGYWLGEAEYSNNGGNGGGGGYYGGGAAINSSGASGGSSFISGHNGCNAISESSTSSNIVHTNQPNHYSEYIFTNTVMIDGLGYNWTNVKGSYVGQIQPNGNIATGHTGNGYAKITLIN